MDGYEQEEGGKVSMSPKAEARSRCLLTALRMRRHGEAMGGLKMFQNGF